MRLTRLTQDESQLFPLVEVLWFPQLLGCCSGFTCPRWVLKNPCAIGPSSNLLVLVKMPVHRSSIPVSLGGFFVFPLYKIIPGEN